MIDKHSGLEIRKTLNGMRKEDGLPTPPQHRTVLRLYEDGTPVDLDILVPKEMRQ